MECGQLYDSCGHARPHLDLPINEQLAAVEEHAQARIEIYIAKACAGTTIQAAEERAKRRSCASRAVDLLRGVPLLVGMPSTLSSPEAQLSKNSSTQP